MMAMIWAVVALRPVKEVSTGVDMKIDLREFQMLKSVITRMKFQKKQDRSRTVLKILIVCLCLVVVQISALAGLVLNFSVITYQSIS